MAAKNLLLLDLDNTLWDFDGNAEEALAELFHRHKLHVSTSHSVHHFIETYRHINKAYWKRYEAGEIHKDTLRTGRFIDTFRELGIPDEEHPENVWDEYLEICPVMTRMMPGAIPFMEDMHAHFKIGILTNGFEHTQRIKIKACGLEPYIDFMLTSEAAGVAKPETAIFDLAIAEFVSNQGDISKVFYAGDTWDTDIRGGIGAGIPTFWYNHAVLALPDDECSKHPLFLGSHDSLSGLGGALLEQLG